MPRPAKPPHLVWIKPKFHPGSEKKLKSRGYWAIKHGPKLVSTGLGHEFRADAEIKRHEYEAALYAQTPIAEHGKDVRDVLVVDLIRYYLERHLKKIEEKSKDRKRDYLNTVERLITFWTGKTVYDINERNCAAYQQKARPGKPLADNTARRELEDLKAMVLFGIRKGQCELRGHIVDWELPPPPPARIEFYSVKEAAALVRAAYRARNRHIGGPKGHKTSVHIARFILIALYTGSRAEVVERASYVELPDRPWIDLESGIFYRAWKGRRVPNNKKADPVRIPDKLLTMMRRWAKQSGNVIEFNGEVGKLRRGFYTLKKRVFSQERAKMVNRHTLKHTCASWLMARGVQVDIVAHYISTSPEIVKKHYGHFAPDFHMEVNEAWKIKPKQSKPQKSVEVEIGRAA